MELFTILIYSLFLLIKSSLSQEQDFAFRALNSLKPFDYDESLSNQNNFIETDKKYVNSGQSIMLICDLPNSMPDGKVVFVKYDTSRSSSSSSSSVDIREDTDDERYEISQQYAWEWSLKINSISEEDSAVYVCKVGDFVIKKFEIIVRLPPRIREDPTHNQKIFKEGSSIEFNCPATGTPKPFITWFVYDQKENRLVQLKDVLSNTLRIDNVTRYTPRYYQCRASNTIPPSDTKNLTFSIEFPPEIEIQPKYDRFENKITLNCTISAYPLTNKIFWRKDSSYIQSSDNLQVSTIRVNEYTLISMIKIYNLGQKDFGLYECAAENDLKVSKMVYNLNRDVYELSDKQMIPIGSSSQLNNSTKSKNNNNKQSGRKNKLLNSSSLSINKKNKQNQIDSISINNLSVNQYDEFKSTKKLKHKSVTTTKQIDESKPYILLINGDNEAKKEDKTLSTSSQDNLLVNKSTTTHDHCLSLIILTWICVLLIR